MGYKFNSACIKCQTLMELDSDWIGMTMHCPNCGNAFDVKTPQGPIIAPRAVPETKAIAAKANIPAPQVLAVATPPNKKSITLLGIAAITFIILILAAVLFVTFFCDSNTETNYDDSFIGSGSNRFEFEGLNIMLANEGPSIKSFSIARERAHRANCISKLKQVGLAMFMYADDNKDFTPHAGGYAFNPPPTEADMDLLIRGGYFGVDSVSNEIRDKFFQCPSDKKRPSYAYVGKGLILGRDNPGLPLVIEYPDNHGKDRWISILHLGGHVTTIPVPENCKTVYQVVDYLIQTNYDGIDYDERGCNKVLENAKYYSR